MTPKDFWSREQALRANAFFSSLFFSWQPFYVFWPSTFPPFRRADAVGCVKICNKINFTYTNEVTVMIFLSNIFLAHFQIFL